ncbi:hypothetical protein D9757_007621 [Collybiopsis confluens]|uniref:Cytochrome P450 n=1 Tax=Collybiopsis confluens TaxID=2823264 RepID=A0A8H5HA63_9AGAR|nr:hypothetical protein D9757_007621 [Collybiopsis confluens]
MLGGPMSSLSLPALITLGGVAAVVAFNFLSYRQKSPALPCPPGPDGSNMPTSDPWAQYQAWGKEYGELVYIQNRNRLIINHARVAVDLCEKRGHIYSDRPGAPIMDITGMSDVLSAMRYSPRWRRHKKLFHQNFRQAAVHRFLPAQYAKIYEFLNNLITTPEDFMQHTTALSQRVIYSSLYGLDIGPEHPLPRKTVEAVGIAGSFLVPGTYPIFDRFPWLVYMPSWFPGCGFKVRAEECWNVLKETDTIPYEMSMTNMKTGQGTSLIAELAAKSEGVPEEIDAIKSMGTVSFLAAADTTMSSISSFLLSMCLDPEVQRKGQEEIDRVVGTHRIPTLEDRRSLPYVEAIYLEVLRLHPPIPLGLPHNSTEDDIYRGYHIPKGCEVVPNIWAMNRDPDIYEEPDKFIPERFLASEEGPFIHINGILAFGFGRRVCPGRYMAENTVWLTIASVLATLSLGKAKDERGREIDIPGEFTNVFFRHPKPFQCSFTPRTPYARDLILAADEK